jgi:hypothetical protein
MDATVRFGAADATCFRITTIMSRASTSAPLRAELGHAPSPVLARFVLALVSERKSWTSLAGSRNGTIWKARPPGAPTTATTAEQVSRSRDSRTSSSPANGNRVPVPPRAMNDSARRGEPLSHPTGGSSLGREGAVRPLRPAQHTRAKPGFTGLSAVRPIAARRLRVAAASLLRGCGGGVALRAGGGAAAHVAVAVVSCDS